tara:strand:- start:1645 stop:1950 length:306 start_codon:yes stop_codon:yes gene_type:complete
MGEMSKGGGDGVSEDDDIETVTPETAKNMTDFELKVGDEWVCIVLETLAKDVPMACPTCTKLNNESILYLLENGQYLYKGLCCGMFAICIANGEDNGLETE